MNAAASDQDLVKLADSIAEYLTAKDQSSYDALQMQLRAAARNHLEPEEQPPAAQAEEPVEPSEAPDQVQSWPHVSAVWGQSWVDASQGLYATAMGCENMGENAYSPLNCGLSTLTTGVQVRCCTVS